MEPRVHDGELVEVTPVIIETILKRDMVVLCRVHGGLLFHLIAGMRNGSYRIESARGRFNGHTPRRNIFGVMTSQPERSVP